MTDNEKKKKPKEENDEEVDLDDRIITEGTTNSSTDKTDKNKKR